jgi:hypothetical protein
MAEAAGLAKVLECTLCKRGYSAQDVSKGLFYPSTGICTECYVQGQKSSRKVWCFGKLDFKRGRKTVLAAFNPTATECKLHCPDRVVCKEFIDKKRRIT